MNKLAFLGKMNFSGLMFYLVMFLLLLGETFFFVLSVPDQISQILDNRANVEEEAQGVADLTSLVTTVENLDRDQLTRDLKAATAALPDEKKTSGILYGLSQLAGNYGVTVSGLEFSPGLVSTGSAQTTEISLGNGVKQVSATLTVDADMTSLTSFLTGLEQASQILGVQSVDFSNQSGKVSKAGLTLQIYYQPPRQIPAQISAKEVKPLSATDEQLLESLPAEDSFTLQPK